MSEENAKPKVINAEANKDVKKIKEKKRKGKDAAVESITNALKTMPSEQQVTMLLSKYAELVEDNHRFQTSCRAFEKAAQQAQKDKDRVELEHSKAVLTRSRLESLCRELQKQNKMIKEENLSRLKEEEERRKEVSNQFNSTLSEISHLMEENSAKNNKLREENQDMASRLKELIQQTEKREDHVARVLKQKELETQLAEAKLAKLHIEFTEQKEKMLEGKKKLLEEISSYQTKLQEKSLSEINLRTQLNSYTEKYEEFQGTLDKSNEIFKSFKKEMDDMSKAVKRHEKETKMWREKADGASKALLQMFNERTKMEGKIESLNKQNGQLQSLCRALQQQVSELRTQLRTQGIREISPPIPSQVSAAQPIQLGGKESSPLRTGSPTLNLNSPPLSSSLTPPLNSDSTKSPFDSSNETSPSSSPPPLTEVERVAEEEEMRNLVKDSTEDAEEVIDTALDMEAVD